MAWAALILAGIIEVAWAIGLKHTDGFTRPWPSVATVVALAASVYLLSIAARTLPIGTAYAVWVGIGAVGTALIGMCLLGETRDLARLLCLALITLGVVGLKAVELAR